MGSILASAVIAQASELAKDPNNVVWTTAQGLEWINDGQRAICNLRPDASSVNHSVTLVPGTKQAVTGRRLFAVIRNMGVDGLTPGAAIRLVDKKIKDEFEPDWHTETVATVIDEYLYDPRNPKVFYVSPPVHGSTVVQVEITEATNPTDMALTTDAISLDDVYATALIEWVCYRFFGRDSQNTPNHSRAVTYLRSFYGLLDKKLPVDLAVRPKMNDEQQ